MHGPAAPENSLSAFAAALEMGAGIECDLRLTADRQIVVFHDADGRRLCDDPLRIGRSSLDDILQLRIGGESVPTLRKLLELVEGRVPLLLEVKVDREIWQWTPALRNALAQYSGTLGIMSFDPRISRIVRACLPNARPGLVLRADRLPFRRMSWLALARPAFVAADRRALGRPWVAALRRRMPVYSWTIRTPEQRRQAQVQADALIWEADGRP